MADGAASSDCVRARAGDGAARQQTLFRKEYGVRRDPRHHFGFGGEPRDYGERALCSTLGAGLVLVGMHWSFAALAFRSHGFGKLVKGTSRALVQEGEIQWDEMRREQISEHDLMEALRSDGQIPKLKQVKEARLERSGKISVIRNSRPPHVLEVSVADRVQTIRIEIE